MIPYSRKQPMPGTLGSAHVGVVNLQEVVRGDYTDMIKFSCGKYNRKDLPTNTIEMCKWTRQVYDHLSSSCKAMRFTVSLSYTNEILVLFPIDSTCFSPASYEELMQIMTTLIKHGLGCQLKLRKRGDRWGCLEEIKSTPTKGTFLGEASSTPSDDPKASTTHNICFSMFTPEVNTAVLSVHKATSQYDRERVRARMRAYDARFNSKSAETRLRQSKY